MNTPRTIKSRLGSVISADDYDFSRFDEQLDSTPGVDVFCSSSRWAESARAAFKPYSPLVVYQGESSTAIFTPSISVEGPTILVPLDSTWMLGSPIAAARPSTDVDPLVEMMCLDKGNIDFILISGISSDSVMFRAVISAFLVRRVRVSLGSHIERCVADISGGVDPWLARRSGKFRASIRKAVKAAEDNGIRFVEIPPEAFGDAVFRVFLELESRSWKGMQGTGISEASMATFCRGVMHRTRGERMTRGVLALRGSEVVGFAFGAVMDGRYRGVQMSYDARFREDGLGNAIQIALMNNLANEGVRAYDLGSVMPYKKRWADFHDATATIVVNLT